MKKRLKALPLLIMPVFFILISLCIGRYPISLSKVSEIIINEVAGNIDAANDLYRNIIWEIRIPRAILGALVGGALGISGASLQGLFKNPLVSPGILGVSSGAGFGAAVAILLFGATAVVYPFALGFGVVARRILSFL